MLAATRTGALPDSPRRHVKRWREGTHRTRAPAETLEAVAPLLGPAGITRVADVTGLDTIGIPVCVAVRPDARSLSVSQGKGLDRLAARASGVMEALELWYGERVEPEHVAPASALPAGTPAIDVVGLPRPAWSRFSRDLPLPWVRGRDLVGGGDLWVPLESVHVDYRLPRQGGMGCFLQTSNGLASGNCHEEAILHALCEVVERDALTVFRAGGLAGRARGRVDLGTVDDAACLDALARYQEAGVDVAVWDATSDVGVACFVAAIADRHANPFRRVPPARGAGSHPHRGIALLRALTEAAQCRLTVITGSRDDHLPSGYERLRDPATDTTVEHPGHEDCAPLRSLLEVPTFDHDAVDDDVDLVLARLRAVGVRQVAVVDLARPESPIAVVRVVVPGLEGMGDRRGYVPGHRARTASAGRP